MWTRRVTSRSSKIRATARQIRPNPLIPTRNVRLMMSLRTSIELIGNSGRGASPIREMPLEELEIGRSRSGAPGERVQLGSEVGV